jgi:hypothetical protein
MCAVQDDDLLVSRLSLMAEIEAKKAKLSFQHSLGRIWKENGRQQEKKSPGIGVLDVHRDFLRFATTMAKVLPPEEGNFN